MSQSSQQDCESFSAIGKERAEFFDDGYFNTKRLLIKVRNSAGVEFTHESEVLPKGGMISSILSSYKNSGAVSLDKFKVHGDGRVSLEACMKLNNFVKLTVAAEDSRQQPGKSSYSFGKLGFLYRNPIVTVASDLDVVNNFALRSSVISSYNSFKLGAHCVVQSPSDDQVGKPDNGIGGGGIVSRIVPELVDLSFISSYRGVGWSASAITRNYMKILSVSYLQHLSPTVTVGAQVDYGILVNSHKFCVGGKVMIDEKSSVKAKLGTNAILSTSFSQKLSDFVRMTVCAEVDISDWSAESHKFGFGLTFG